MLTIRLAVDEAVPDTLVLPVASRTAATDTTSVDAADDDVAGGDAGNEDAAGGKAPGVLLFTACGAEEAVREEATAYLVEVEHSGAAGVAHTLARPLAQPKRVVLVGVGAGDEAGWRSAGAAVARTLRGQPSATIGFPPGTRPEAVHGVAVGLWLASYRFRLASDAAEKAPKLADVTVVVDECEPYEAALRTARTVAEATMFARDLTNTPSERKSPAWIAEQVQLAARPYPGLTVAVREPAQLATDGFGGVLAVGRGSARPPRLVELSWRPTRAGTHVVLVGKGITFDTGGICVKPREGMKLMRKDMGGAAAVVAATIGAAALDLPVRITTLAPLAENMIGADSYRPGDVIRHYGGRTTEVLNTDAEGRLVLADALAYAVSQLRPDLVVDFATLTGAQGIALGKRTAALYSGSDALAGALCDAAAAAGERAWRMPLPLDYVEALDSDVADLVNSTEIGGGSVMAALYLREFVGAAADRWAHLDMSSPAWADSADGELVKGATGWGVRTLLRWLESLAPASP